MTPRNIRLSQQVYRLRVLGLAIGALPVLTILYEHGAPATLWIIALVHAFVWPHVAWWHARSKADDARPAERINLVLDSAFGGMWIAVMEFNLLPSALIASMMTLDRLSWGWGLVLRSMAAMAVACALTALVAHPAFHPATSMPVLIASLPLMVAYPIAVSLALTRLVKLDREKRVAIEQTAGLRDQLAHVARVGTLGEMAAGLAHELNQPLTAIHIEANAALEIGRELSGQAGWDSTRESLERISEQSLRAGEIVRRMRMFARRGPVVRERLAILPLLREVLALVDNDLRHNGIQTTIELPGDLPDVMADRISVQQVLVNLLRNAMEAMVAAGGTARILDLRAERVGGFVRVSITDSGGGVDPVILGTLFQPFHTTKPAGMGLGLSICQSLIEAHGGRIGAGPRPHPDHGARFYFELPVAS